MTRADKREQKIRENPRNVSLEDFEWLINRYGYIKMGGSHASAVINTKRMAYPRENPVRLPYVLQLFKLIEKEGR